MKKLFLACFILILFACENKAEKDAQHAHVSDIYYTCSMDPQVLEHKPGKCPICHMDLTPVSLKQLQGNTIKLSAEQSLLANIQTKIVGFDNIKNQIHATGIVKENENNAAFINARVDGRIDKLFIKTNGVSIYKGQILYEIYSEMLAATQSDFITNWKLVSKQPNDILLKNIYQNSFNKLVLWGITHEQIEQLKLLDNPPIPFPIVSSASGIVKNIRISEGSTVMEGQPIFELTAYNTLWVDAQFYEKELDESSVGKTVHLTFENGNKNLTEGKIIETLPQVAPSSTITIVRIAFQNTGNFIKPGMQANIIWQVKADKSLTVPAQAVLQNATENTVWVKNTDGSYEPKMVHTGKATNTSVEILHGLKAGDEVVTSGAYLLQSEFIFKKGMNPMSGHDMSNM